MSPQMVKLGALLQWGASVSKGKIYITRYPETWVPFYESLTNRKMNMYKQKGEKKSVVYYSSNRPLIDFLKSQGFVFKKGERKIPAFVKENFNYLKEYLRVVYDGKGYVLDRFPGHKTRSGRIFYLNIQGFSREEAEDIYNTLKYIEVSSSIQKSSKKQFKIYISRPDTLKFGDFIEWKCNVPEKQRGFDLLKNSIKGPYRKIDPEWIDEWKKLREEGFSYRKIANRYGVSNVTVFLYLKK